MAEQDHGQPPSDDLGVLLSNGDGVFAPGVGYGDGIVDTTYRGILLGAFGMMCP